MRIVGFVHFYPPWRNAGSEIYLHALLEHLAAAGHAVTVIATNIPAAPLRYRHGHVEVIRTRSAAKATAQLRALRPHLVITHHQNAGPAINGARELRVPSVFLVHNDFALTRSMFARHPDLTIFNSAWIASRFAHLAGQHMIIHPPVWAHEHATTPGEHVTLVNLNEHKGANIFYELARRLPQYPFLGVEGGHGTQILRRHLPNVTLQTHCRNMRDDVWARTRILIAPSLYESYGMGAIEAAASGIPAIANPTSGLCESLGPAGIFCDRSDLDAWEHTITELMDDQAAWDAASTRALARSADLDPAADLDAFAAATEELATRRGALLARR